jgi:hypothetical protein
MFRGTVSVGGYLLGAVRGAAANIVLTATAEKAAEKFGPAAGAAVPFVPILVAVLGRRGIGGAAFRRLARRLVPSRTAALAKRADEFQSVLDPIAAKQRTTAVLETSGGTIIGGGVRDLNPAQRALAKQGEILSKLPGKHAEITVLKEAMARGLKPKAIATTRDFCQECRKALEEAGATITGPRTAVWK